MKRIICFGILAALTFSACQQENFEPVEDLGFSATIEEFEGHTRTSLTTGNSVVWSKDDMIAIFKGYSTPSQFKVSSSSAGSTTASFSEVSSNTKGGSIPSNVAVYPYDDEMECSFIQESSNGNAYEISDVVFPAEQIYSKGSFGNRSFVMAAVTNGTKDKKLKFRNVSGAIRLKVKGKQTITAVVISGEAGEIIAGKATVTAYADGSAPMVGEFEDGSGSVTLNCGEGVQLSQSVATEFIIALPPTTFSQGFTVTLFSADGKTSEHSTDKSNTVGRSKILNMPEILFGRPSGDLTPDGCEDIAEKGTANSYIVSEPGDYSFPTVKGNSTQSVGTVASVEVLWETFGTSVAPEVGDLITDVMYENDRIFFRTAYDLREGNAVIAARNSSGTILWSWHIWLTDQPQEHIYANGAGTMMDRNLGATSATPGDVGALGLLYQWGRKDPFLGCAEVLTNNAPTSMLAKSTINWPSVNKSTSSVGTIDYAVKHPTTFIAANTMNYDWYYTGGSHLETKRWSVEKTIYDPCPAGWRVPDGSSSPWSVARFSYYNVFDDSKGGMLFPSYITGSPAWYPATGYYSHTGKLQNTVDSGEEGSETINLACGAYWGSVYYAAEATMYDLLFTGDGNVVTRNYNKPGFAFAVRCYKEGSSTYEESDDDYIDEYGINHGKGTEIDGVVWAPVNCGYHETDYMYGKLYQWGRKYGQGYSGNLYNVNGNKIGKYEDETYASSYYGPITSLSTGQSESNKNYFFTVTEEPFDWLYSPNDYLWNSGKDENPIKTDYDPCPEGWRIPTYSEMTALSANYSSCTIDSDGRSGYWMSGSRTYSESVPSIFLPFAGILDPENAIGNNRGYDARYWTSMPYEDGSCFLYLNLDDSEISSDYYISRAYGQSVRCVQE